MLTELTFTESCWSNFSTLCPFLPLSVLILDKPLLLVLWFFLTFPLFQTVKFLMGRLPAHCLSRKCKQCRKNILTILILFISIWMMGLLHWIKMLVVYDLTSLWNAFHNLEYLLAFDFFICLPVWRFAPYLVWQYQVDIYCNYPNPSILIE